MSIIDSTKTNIFQTEKADNLFSEIMHAIRSMKLMLESGAAKEDEAKMFEELIKGDQTLLSQSVRLTSSTHFVRNLVFDYLKLLNESNLLEKLSVLALTHSDNKVYTWIVIPDDDWDTEKSLYGIKSIIDAKYIEYGYSIDYSILEESDDIEVPNHYTIIHPTKSEK